MDSAPSCAAASIPRAMPETTTRPARANSAPRSSAMRRPLTEALSPPTSATARRARRAASPCTAITGGVVAPGKQRWIIGIPQEKEPGAGFCGAVQFADHIRLGRHHGRVGLAAGAGQPRQRSECGGGSVEACEHAAVGHRADAFGASQAQAVGVVLLAHGGVLLAHEGGWSGTGKLLLPPGHGPVGAGPTPCRRCAARCRRAGGGCWRGGG